MVSKWQQLIKDLANARMLAPFVMIGAAGFSVALRSIGYFDFGQFAFIGIKISCLLSLESLLVLWVINGMPESKSKWKSFVFAMKMQAQAGMEVYLSVYMGAAVMLGAFYTLNWIQPKRGITELISVKNMYWLNEFFIFICPLMILFVTAWRLYELRIKGLDFLSVSKNVLNHREFSVQTSKAATAERLECYLAALTLDGTTGLQRLWYGKKPSISNRSANGEVIFEVRWPWCPSLVRVVVESTSSGSALVRASCELRSGYWRADLFVNPQDAMALMKYMQVGVFQLLESELKLSASTTRQDKLRNQATEMQLRILQAQIEPHFLFNTLASVRHLYRSSTDAGELMMDHVITYLRCTMQELRSDVSTVGKEMDLVLHYLAIMKIRMGERLSYSFIHSDDVANRAFPPAMLISLVENAIKHGLNDRADGKLTISTVREEQLLKVTVLDNGPGFSSVQGTGVGLSNIRQRLEAIYGNRAWLEVGALASGGFVASIVVPFPSGDSAETKVLT